MYMHIAADLPISAEAALDREIEELIAKIVAGTATDEEAARYNELSRQRVRRMQPSAVTRFEELKKLRRRA